MATSILRTRCVWVLVLAALFAGDAGRPIERLAPRLRLCQALGPAAPHPIWAVDSAAGKGVGEVGWDSRGCADWQRFAQGEYLGHERLPHVPHYRLRVFDRVSVFYLRTRERFDRAYRLQVGDRVRVESLTAGSTPASGSSSTNDVARDALDRELGVQPDGMITLPLVGRVPAAGRSVEALQADLENRFKATYKVPAITVTPLQVNTKLEDLLDTVDNRGGTIGGRQVNLEVNPDGSIQLPGLGSVYVQGLTPDQVKMEIDARYGEVIPGVEVTVVLTQRAPRFVYVLGQVNRPGRFELTGPTTVMQALALAEGTRLGGNLRQVVVFRRGEDWRLMATMVDLRGALYGRRPTPADDIWLNDSDIVLVPKSPIQIADDFIEQVFVRGLYAAVPTEVIWGTSFTSSSGL